MTLFFPNEKYDVIYADPPWSYNAFKTSDNLCKNCGCANDHYPTMSLKDICELPVGDIAAKDCVLFLWATYPCLPEAFEVIKAWGFKYKTVGFTWAKLNKSGLGYKVGLGHWTRANCEICLLATKGKPKRVAKDVRQLIISPLEGHSKKPAETRKRIERLMGGGKKIELFARQRVDGWDAWGNDV